MLSLHQCTPSHQNSDSGISHSYDSLLSTNALSGILQFPSLDPKLISSDYETPLRKELQDKQYLFVPDLHRETLSIEELTVLIPFLKESWGMEALAMEISVSKHMYFDELNVAIDPDIINYILEHIEQMLDMNVISDPGICTRLIRTCKEYNIAVYPINVPERTDRDTIDFEAMYDLVGSKGGIQLSKKSFTAQMEQVAAHGDLYNDPEFHRIQNLCMAEYTRAIPARRIAIWVGAAHSLPILHFERKGLDSIYAHSLRRLLGPEKSTCLYLVENQAKGHYNFPNLLDGFSLSTGRTPVRDYAERQRVLEAFRQYIPGISNHPFTAGVSQKRVDQINAGSVQAWRQVSDQVYLQ